MPHNLALAQILRRLGFDCRPLFALKVRVFDNESWTMVHTWLRVTVAGESRMVCAARIENEPGKVHFRPLSRVHRGSLPALFLSHLGLIFFSGILEWKALLAGSPPPAWACKERVPGH